MPYGFLRSSLCMVMTESSHTGLACDNLLQDKKTLLCVQAMWQVRVINSQEL